MCITLWISFVDFIDFIWNPLDSIWKSRRKWRISLESVVLTHFRWISWNPPDFITDFTANFMLDPPDFIINFIANSITSTRNSLKSTRFHEIHSISEDSTETNTISLWISLWIPFQWNDAWMMHEICWISWNQQDLTQFHKIQHNFTKTNRVYWNPWNSKDFIKSNRSLLKATEFNRISLNSLHISLWMSFMDLTADFITDFTAVFIMNFTANFMLNPPDFIIDIMTISWHLPGFHWNQKDFMKSTAFHMISLWISMWILSGTNSNATDMIRSKP